MPTSNLAMAPLALSYLQGTITDTTTTPKILDVGPGHGKYGVLMREYLTPTPIVDAIEAWQPYIDNFNLEGIYRNVYCADILEVPPELLGQYDALFMGDVIEHLDKQAALDFLDRCPVPIVVVTPAEFFHNADGLPWTETHRSAWTEQDFTDTGRVHRMETYLGGIVVHLT